MVEIPTFIFLLLFYFIHFSHVTKIYKNKINFMYLFASSSVPNYKTIYKYKIVYKHFDAFITFFYKHIPP